MKWITFTFSFIMVLIQSCGQNVSLNVLQNSIQTKMDTLFFTFKIQNNSTDTLVFYNLNVPEYGCKIMTDSLLQKRQPGLLVDILNENNELPSVIKARTGRTDFSQYSVNEYQILKPKEYKEYHIALDLWPINLKKGYYKLQIRYYSNNYYWKSFIQAKKIDPKLNSSMLFKGLLKSNFVSVMLD